MVSKTTSSYILPGIFLGIMLVTFLAGTWMLYERIRGGHQAAFEEAVAALPPFDNAMVQKEAAKKLGFPWPLKGPKFTLEAVASRISKLLAEDKSLVKKSLEDKYYVEAGYVKASDGSWQTQEALVKREVEQARKDFDETRAKEVKRLMKENSSGGFFPLHPPKPAL